MRKRLFDFVMALSGLLVLFPLLILIAAAVVFSSGFPLFFKQIRVGLGGRNFRLIKFRTMRVLRDAESGRFDAGGTQRVTAVGRFLRKTKMDELPQLWNVARGDMSLVGPRPEVRTWVDAYPTRWAEILKVRPGITDPASIEFRNEEKLLAESPDPERAYREIVLPRKLDLYEAYVRKRTFFGDIGLLVKTLSVLIWDEKQNTVK